MRSTLRLLAKLKPDRYLEPYSNTGLTGLFTHPAPRPTLIHIYRNTLDKLKELPESSVYRQSTEALTRHRLKIVESVKPEGFDEWNAKAQEFIAKDPNAAIEAEKSYISYQGLEYSNPKAIKEEWDGDTVAVTPEGGYGLDVKYANDELRKHVSNVKRRTETPDIPWDPEPPLDSTQISELETQIGAGLIEEVIQVAEGELRLIDEMAKVKVWEELEEKAPEGQWTYFERGTHTTQTQKP